MSMSPQVPLNRRTACILERQACHASCAHELCDHAQQVILDILQVKNEAKQKPSGSTVDLLKAPAPLVLYLPPSSSVVRRMLGLAGGPLSAGGSSLLLDRSSPLLLDRGEDSDEELATAEAPLELLSQNFPAGASPSITVEGGSGHRKIALPRHKPLGFKLLREVWNNQGTPYTERAAS